MKREAMPIPELGYDQAALDRRAGYLVIPGVLPAAHVEACKAALSALMQERIPRRSTNIHYEAGQSIEGLCADQRELRVRRLADASLSGCGERCAARPVDRPQRQDSEYTTFSPRCRTNGRKSRSACSSVKPSSMQRVAMSVSMVLRMVIPCARSNRWFSDALIASA